MSLLRTLIRPYLYTRYGIHRLTGTGAFGRQRPQPLTMTIDPGWPSLKRQLWRHHVKQFHESSCSVASVVGCINALRSLQDGDAAPVDQHEILERVTTGHWKARMTSGGYRGHRGLPLALLGKVVRSSLDAYDLVVGELDLVQAAQRGPRAKAIRTRLKQRLAAFDRQGRGLIIAHFDQGSLAPTLNIPHISPVGGYDPASDTVTLLDVDPEQPVPYRVSFDRFYRALACNYHNIFRAFGYGSGGYVYIQLHAPTARAFEEHEESTSKTTATDSIGIQPSPAAGSWAD